MHYMIHYPSCIEKFGPLSHLWAMRFEAKHQYFKDIARKVRNRKNLSHTLAVRHQFLQCFAFIGSEDKSIPSTTHCRRVLSDHLPEAVKEFIFVNNLEFTNIFTATSLSISGRVYRVGCCLHESTPEDDLPQFVQVCEIFFVNRVLVISARCLETICFDEHFHVYVVRETQDYKILTSFTSYQTEPLYITEHKGRFVINSRHSLF